MIIYTIAVASFLPFMLIQFEMSEEIVTSEFTRKVIIIVLQILMFPLFIQRNLSGLRFICFFGVVSIAYVVILIFGQTPQYIKLNFDYDNVCWFHLSMASFQAFALYIFSFIGHTVIFMIKKELVEPTRKKLQTIIFRSVFVETVLYLIVSYSGYLSMLQQTPPLIINRTQLPNTKDYLMLIGRFGICLKVLTSLALNEVLCREQIFKFIGINRKTKTWEHFLGTFLISTTVAFIAIIFPNIINAFGFVGGYCGIALSFIFPLLLYLKTNEEKWTSWKNLIIILFFSIICFFGFVAGTVSILDTVRIVDISSYACILQDNSTKLL